MKEELKRIGDLLEKIVPWFEREMPESKPRTGKKAEAVAEIHADLMGIDGWEILQDIKPNVQTAWITAFGLPLIQRELPLAAAKWASDENRQNMGALPLYLNRWFQRAKSTAPAGAQPQAALVKQAATAVNEFEVVQTKKERERVLAQPCDLDCIDGRIFDDSPEGGRLVYRCPCPKGNYEPMLPLYQPARARVSGRDLAAGEHDE